jgi:hypothetical protein
MGKPAESLAIDTKSTPISAQLTKSENMLNEIFSFLPGYTIIHKIGLLNKKIRNALTKLDPFGQERVISLKIQASG